MASSDTAHSCTHCQTRFLIRDSDEPRPRLTINSPKSDHEWRLWPADKEPITVSELEQMVRNGCSFAKYLYEKLPSGEGEVPGDAVISRVPPHQDDTEPNSIVVTLDHRSHTHAFFTYMAEECLTKDLSIGYLV
ncbi:hypothetical protein QQX98_005895 [Neonectria punicea]|uniref:Uncharacterized protein n=1 Tax=Neonectria punicea TaxID=979145 RepID=A0ABR1H3F7_9HYPO